MSLVSLGTLLLALPLILTLATQAHAGDTVRLDSLVTQCRLVVDGNKFDLCRLFGRQEQGGWLVERERRTPPSVTTLQYRVMLDGKLPKNASLEDNMQCPDGTTICLTTYTRYEGTSFDDAKVLHTIPVAGSLSAEVSEPFVQFGKYDPGLSVDADMFRRWNTTEDSLRVILHGGYYVDQKQSATIHFICDQDHAKSNFKHLWTYNGNHLFTWTSPHACVQEAGAPSNGDGEQELVTPPLMSRTSKRLWTIALITTCITAGVVYLIYFPPRAVRRQAQRYLKHHPSFAFRVGEGVLVRWAHEELEHEEGLEVVEGDDVNGFVDEEEHIPLKPSPRKGGFASYGSA